MGKTVLITGATGMVGSQVLDLLLADPGVDRIVSISRRRTGVHQTKLDEIVHADFLDFGGLEAEMTGLDLCIYCLGVYQGQVPKDAFFEITCDYQKALTDVLGRVSPDATFVLFGAQGADPTEASRATFARAKGRAENLLTETGFPKKYILRPGYIHPTGSKTPVGVLYRLLSRIGGPLLRFFPNLGITDRDLARALVSVGMTGDGSTRVLENRDIRDVVSLLDQ